MDDDLVAQAEVAASDPGSAADSLIRDHIHQEASSGAISELSRPLADELGPDAAHAIVQAAIDGGIGGIALPTGALPLYVAAWSLARYFKHHQQAQPSVTASSPDDTMGRFSADDAGQPHGNGAYQNDGEGQNQPPQQPPVLGSAGKSRLPKNRQPEAGRRRNKRQAWGIPLPTDQWSLDEAAAGDGAALLAQVPVVTIGLKAAGTSTAAANTINWCLSCTEATSTILVESLSAYKDEGTGVVQIVPVATENYRRDEFWHECHRSNPIAESCDFCVEMRKSRCLTVSNAVRCSAGVPFRSRCTYAPRRALLS